MATHRSDRTHSYAQSNLIAGPAESIVLVTDMSQPGWRLLERKFSGTTLLLTGAVGLTLGWAASALWQYSTAAEVTPTEQDDLESNAEVEENSEPSTPRSLGGPPRQTPRRTNTGLNFNAAASATAEYKQAILIRTDLDMVISQS